MCAKFQTNQRTFFSWKKVPATHKEFDFFFQKYPRFWKLKLEYFSIKKVFYKTAKMGNFSFFKLIMSEVSKDLGTKNFRQNPRFFNLKLDFFPVRIFFAFFFQIGKYLIYLNFIFVNLKKKQGTFFDQELIINSARVYVFTAFPNYDDHSLRSRLSGEGRRS